MIKATVSWPHLWKIFAQNSLRAEGGIEIAQLVADWLIRLPIRTCVKPPVTSDCSLAPKLLFVDWLKILTSEKQAVQFQSPLVLVCEQKRSSHKLQKEIRTKINQESTISWEKFCNSISLESDPKKSWRKRTNLLKPKGPRSYPTLKLGNKTAKTNPEKAQLFAESVERNFGIESHLFSKSQFDRINKFVEAHSYHFTPLDSLHDNITDTDDDSDLVADVDPDTLIRIVRTELKNGKAPGIDNVYNTILKKAIGTGFYKVLARAFTISLKLGFIPHVWKIAVLCMLIKPDKPPSQTTSYRPISLLSAIMKLFERVIEKRLRKHLEDNGFFSKYQSGFRKSKSTNDHLFRLSQTIMESFNRGEHVIAAFQDVEKAFDNVWHNGLRYKIYQLDLPTKLCRWLSDFLVGRVIQVKIEGFLSQKFTQKQVFRKVQTWVHYYFLSMSMTCQIPITTRLTSRSLQMTPANGLWVKTLT